MPSGEPRRRKIRRKASTSPKAVAARKRAADKMREAARLYREGKAPSMKQALRQVYGKH